MPQDDDIEIVAKKTDRGVEAREETSRLSAVSFDGPLAVG
jgi:hypothetical protein